jgi:hypothetical protein
MELFENEWCQSRQGGGITCTELRECVSNTVPRCSTYRHGGLSILQAERPKPVPVCPDRLRIEVEDRPGLVVGRDWLEATRPEEEMAASGDGISDLRTSVPNPISFTPARRSSMLAVILREWKRERKFWILGQLSECRTIISKRPVKHFSSMDNFF